MLFRRFTPLLSFTLFGNKQHSYDLDMTKGTLPDEPQTGWERVKKMYSRDEHEDISLELHHISQSAMSGTFIGACIGGFVQSRTAYLNFIENNQATIFKSTLQAKKKLQDYVTIAFAKGAVRWGWRLGAFSGCFSLITTTIAAYRGDTSLIEYVSAGAITGALYKLNMGLAGTIVGAGLGAALGLMFGAAIVLILKATGVKMEDIRKALYKFKEGREKQYNEALDKASDIKTDPLTVHHEMLVKEKGPQTIQEVFQPPYPRARPTLVATPGSAPLPFTVDKLPKLPPLFLLEEDTDFPPVEMGAAPLLVNDPGPT